MGAKKEKVDYFKKGKKLGLDTINPFKYDPEYINKQPFSKELTDSKLRTIQSSPEYAAMIASMDENIGRIIKELKVMKIEKTRSFSSCQTTGDYPPRKDHQHRTFHLREKKDSVMKGESENR